MALRFGIPIPALRAHVGKHIQPETRRGVPFIVDDHGQNLLTAPALRRTSKGISRNACPRVTDEDARNKMNGIIPDLVLQVGHFPRDERSLAGCDHLADTKPLNASKQH